MAGVNPAHLPTVFAFPPSGKVVEGKDGQPLRGNPDKCVAFKGNTYNYKLKACDRAFSVVCLKSFSFSDWRVHNCHTSSANDQQNYLMLNATNGSWPADAFCMAINSKYAQVNKYVQ